MNLKDVTGLDVQETLEKLEEDFKVKHPPEGYDSPEGRELYRRLLQHKKDALSGPLINLSEMSKEELNEFFWSR